MARMLQALKNLEARSVRPAGGGAAAPSVGTVTEQETAEIKRAVRRADTPLPLNDKPSEVVARPPVTIEAVSSALAGLDVAIEDPPTRFEGAASGAPGSK